MDPLLDRAPCGFVSIADDGTILDINLTLVQLLGYTRVELLGWHLQKILPPGGRIFYQTHVFPIVKMHGVAEEIYIALRTKDAVDLPVLMNVARHTRDGTNVNDCVFVRMTQRHLYEDELLQARRLAEQANAAKAKFLSMMSHDLRTPLTSISGHASLLANGLHGPMTGPQHDSVMRIREACAVLLGMINDILSFAQLDSGKVEVRLRPVQVADSIARAEGLTRVQAESSGLTFHVEACNEDVMASADPDKLQQVLLNLLTNAIKFTSSGGTVAVSCDRDGDRVLIRVRDNGVGIPAEQLERVFDAFVQLGFEPDETHQRGVGLGLAISKELTAAMGGELTVESVVGEGSVFTVALAEG
ncbi:MAG TPA: PAS domain-containing sensor histidine kinase [Thermoanaerobaculia bacterium]|jgi:PAS domain S-box-containing protein